MRIILKINNIDLNTRVIKAILFKPLKLPFDDAKRGIVYIFQHYSFDNGYSSGIYKGWYWEDVIFEEKLGV